MNGIASDSIAIKYIDKNVFIFHISVTMIKHILNRINEIIHKIKSWIAILTIAFHKFWALSIHCFTVANVFLLRFSVQRWKLFRQKKKVSVLMAIASSRWAFDWLADQERHFGYPLKGQGTKYKTYFRNCVDQSIVSSCIWSSLP